MSALGFKSIMGIGLQADYDTALAAPTDKVPFYSESLVEEIENLPDETLEGTPAVRDLHENFRTNGGTVEVPLLYTELDTTYKSIDLLIAAAMGTCTWHAGSGTNILSLKDDLDVFLTKAILKGSTVFENVGSCENNMTFNFAANDFAKVSFDSYAKLQRYSGTSFSQAELEGLTNAINKLVPFKQVCFFIGDQVDALVDADKLGTNAISLALTNGMSEQEQQSCTDGGDTLYPMQPLRDDFRNADLTFTVPRYANETIKDWADNQTRLQAKIVCTLSASYTITIKMPHIKLMIPEINVGGPEKLVQNVTAKVLKNNGNSFMQTVASTNITNEFVVELKNDRTGSIL